MTIAPIDKTRVASTGEEYLALIASDATWLARSADDVRRLRATGPLAKLSDYDFATFVSSLRFKDGGVMTGTYKPLMSSLAITEIFDVFERFGIAREYLPRLLEFECVGGSCTFHFWYFCASNCGTHVDG